MKRTAALLLIIGLAILLIFILPSPTPDALLGEKSIDTNLLEQKESLPFIVDDNYELISKEVRVPNKFRINTFEEPRFLNIPEGFEISVFVTGAQKVRFMGFSPDGVLHAGTLKIEGEVYAFPDRDGDGVADEIVRVAENLDVPNSVAFVGDSLYVPTVRRIRILTDEDGDLVADKNEVFTESLPEGVFHSTRTIAVNPETDWVYISVGSSCNVCVPGSPEYGSIMEFTPAGRYVGLFATGLRNTVGMTFNRETGELWGTDMGRDHLGDDLPPDEINMIKKTKHYGWPFCYGDQEVDPWQPTPLGFCKTTELPALNLPAHVAPLGLRFIEGDLYVAYHGSWNRTIPTGYKVVRITNPEKEPEIKDFITGWLVSEETEEQWGRPVDIIQGPDNAVYISDDFSGTIYRVVRAK